MSVESIGGAVSPLTMIRPSGPETHRGPEQASLPKGTQQLLRAADEPASASERKAMTAANQRETMATYGYDSASGKVGAASTTGDRVGTFLNTFA